MIEVEHHAFELALRHLAVRDADVGFRQELPQVARDAIDVLDAVVDEIYLPAAPDLAEHGLADLPIVPFAHEGLDRQPLGRRRRDDRQVAQAAERHVQRARNRSRGQREHVDLRAQTLQALLVLHAEPMLLVDDHEPEPFEADVGLQQLVRADHDVDGAVRESLEGGRGARRAAEAR